MLNTQISINVRYLLWKAGVARQEWTSWLELRGAGLYLARDLVAGTRSDDKITGTELRDLSYLFDLGNEGESVLRFEDLPSSRENILVANLRFLFEQVPHGGKQDLARQIGVDPATISRWRSGAYVPEGPSLRSLILAFGLRADIDLKQEPLFLSVDPISASAQRKWLYAQIEKLSAKEVQELFPSLKRMLEDR